VPPEDEQLGKLSWDDGSQKKEVTRWKKGFFSRVHHGVGEMGSRGKGQDRRAVLRS